MVDSRIQLWERFDGWQTFLTELGVKNVLKSPVIQAEEVARQRHLLVEVVEEMEALHVDPDERSVSQAQPHTLFSALGLVHAGVYIYRPCVKLCYVPSRCEEREFPLCAATQTRSCPLQITSLTHANH